MATSKSQVHVDEEQGPSSTANGQNVTSTQPTEYKVYKRRFIGLFQLSLLNIIVSWDWLSFSPVSKTSAQYFNVTEGTINWLSTGFLFAFVAATPATIWTLNRHGPKTAIMVSACLLLVGNWIRYAGARSSGGIFGVVMFGQILIGLAQPFCLSCPTLYSDRWFSEKGRTSATAVASLANPLGGALGQLIDPFWTSKPSDVPNMVLYITIISSIACIPSFFIHANPPTPPSAASTAHLHHHTPPHTLKTSLLSLRKSVPFWLITIPYWIYVGFFNSLSSLLNQILQPYGFSEDEAGIAGAILIVVGLIASAIMSPITDRYKAYLLTIKIFIPILGICYLAFIWAPSSGTIAAPYVICALLGASSFILVPIVLEYIVEIMYPITPEVGSTICWAGGQLLGGIFIVIQNALKDGENAHPPRNMKRALIFQAVIALVVVPLPMLLGLWGIEVRKRRLEVERAA